MRAVGEKVQRRHLHQLIIGGQRPGVAGQGGRIARDVDQALRRQMEQGLQGFRGHTAARRVQQGMVPVAGPVLAGQGRQQAGGVPGLVAAVAESETAGIAFRQEHGTAVVFHAQHLVEMSCGQQSRGPGTAIDVQQTAGRRIRPGGKEQLHGRGGQQFGGPAVDLEEGGGIEAEPAAAQGQIQRGPVVRQGLAPAVEAEHAPFSGDIADGKVWGRGASDTKCSVMGFFQACEELLREGYVPEQDVYLSSSCTEEFAGPGGGKLVDELRRRGVKPFLVCDEGGGIISEPIGGIHGNFAMLGVFEKGKADVRFTARSNGGHASAPPKNSPVARLAAFVDSMEKHPPFRKKFEPEVSAMFARLAAYAPFALRLLFGNLWLFAPLMKLVMPALSPQAGAMLRTTAAFTMLSGSDACNVLPQEASVWANLRFIPHQGMDESLALIKKRAEKYGIETEVLSASDYSAPADIHGEAWRRVTDTIAEVFPGLAWSPYVMTGATDAKNYQAICDNCIRFAPVIYGPEQMRGMHGVNENIETACLPGAVDFYKALIGKNR